MDDPIQDPSDDEQNAPNGPQVSLTSMLAAAAAASAGVQQTGYSDLFKDYAYNHQALPGLQAGGLQAGGFAGGFSGGFAAPPAGPAREKPWKEIPNPNGLAQQVLNLTNPLPNGLLPPAAAGNGAFEPTAKRPRTSTGLSNGAGPPGAGPSHNSSMEGGAWHQRGSGQLVNGPLDLSNTGALGLQPQQQQQQPFQQVNRSYNVYPSLANSGELPAAVAQLTMQQQQQGRLSLGAYSNIEEDILDDVPVNAWPVGPGGVASPPSRLMRNDRVSQDGQAAAAAHAQGAAAWRASNRYSNSGGNYYPANSQQAPAGPFNASTFRFTTQGKHDTQVMHALANKIRQQAEMQQQTAAGRPTRVAQLGLPYQQGAAQGLGWGGRGLPPPGPRMAGQGQGRQDAMATEDVDLVLKRCEEVSKG